MNENEQIEALAKLAGRAEPAKIVGSIGTDDGKNIQVWNCPHYLELYDAIIPLAQKYLRGRMFNIETTPRQLATSVLKETGLWKH